MRLIEMFEAALISKMTNYFIIDSGNYEKDNDFVEYAWQRSKNNKIKTGDVFIYRKPQKLSANGRFYFYGAGQFADVIGEDDATGIITNGHLFEKPIMQKDLDLFEWEWKNKGDNWEHYWGQYGINKITRNDFVNILDMVEGDSYSKTEEQQTIEYESKIASGNYYVSDEHAMTKVRSWQRAWSSRVKDNYGYQCAMCDISTTDLLVGSHIVPVGKDADNRMNPSNGISLCILHDGVFDKGYITILDDQIIFSTKLEDDSSLLNTLNACTNKTIRKAKFDKINPEFLKYHRINIFKG